MLNVECRWVKPMSVIHKQNIFHESKPEKKSTFHSKNIICKRIYKYVFMYLWVIIIGMGIWIGAKWVRDIIFDDSRADTDELYASSTNRQINKHIKQNETEQNRTKQNKWTEHKTTRLLLHTTNNQTYTISTFRIKFWCD